jgi:hypothetical protein
MARKKTAARRTVRASRYQQSSNGALANGAVPRATTHPEPPFRRLQIYSFDPSIDVNLKTAGISRSVVNVRWEKDLAPGPVGEYVEVVDIDPSSHCVYDPLDLSDPHLLAQDGLTPSTGNPQFHQQMVYAVVMKTVHNFEQALGRPIFWAERSKDEQGKYIQEMEQRYVQHLRIYPHALREENAYYSPAKRALLFGYFNARTSDPREEMPGGVVFTCLSHHIVAHETTHAILDGLYPRLLQATNQDMLAFHEAFGDIIAIFQTFTLPGVLLNEIQTTRGDLRDTGSMLARLAPQFARSTGRGNALRDALGPRAADGTQAAPDPTLLARTTEPHERGAILVAAVFDAFLQMYENSIADLRRIATGGTGVLPQGDIHPDLARRFANEAARQSQRVLNICIRSLDYLPPVDVTFGDFLRALITSDADFFPDDPHRYRLAFLDAFRNRGIYPADVRVLGEDTLRWQAVAPDEAALFGRYLPPINVLRSMAYSYDSEDALRAILEQFDEDRAYSQKVAGEFDKMAREFIEACWKMERSSCSEPSPVNGRRFSRFLVERCFAIFLHHWIVGRIFEDHQAKNDRDAIANTMGIDVEAILSSKARLEIHAVRPTVRLQSDGRTKVELLVILTQRKMLSLPPEGPLGEKTSKEENDAIQPVKFRGGCTLIIDPEQGKVRYSIRKSISSSTRLARQAEFLRDQVDRLGLTGLARANGDEDKSRELFAMMHAESNDGEAVYG